MHQIAVASIECRDNIKSVLLKYMRVTLLYEFKYFLRQKSTKQQKLININITLVAYYRIFLYDVVLINKRNLIDIIAGGSDHGKKQNIDRS